jgi:hypothetical protein
MLRINADHRTVIAKNEAIPAASASTKELICVICASVVEWYTENADVADHRGYADVINQRNLC